MENVENRKKIGRAGSMNPPHAPHAPWPRVKLGEVCEFHRGLTYPKSVEVENSKNVVLRSNNVDLLTGKLDFSELKYISDSYPVDASKSVSKGTLLMCMANGSKAHLGKVALIDQDYGYAFGGFMGLIVPANRVTPEYLNLVLSSFQFKQLLSSLTDGANINNLKFSDISNFDFPLPPLSEQKKIVAKLERELAAVDAMEKKFEELEQTAETGFKAELKEAFDEVEIDGTKTRKLEDVCELIADCPHTTAKDEGEGYPLVRTPNVGFMRLVYDDMHRVSEPIYRARTSRGVPREGDLIFAREAPAGNVAVIQGGEVVCLGQRTVLLRLKKDVVFSDYVALYILSPKSQSELLKLSAGATVAHVNVADIRELPILVPSFSRQQSIINFLDVTRSRKDKLVAAARKGAETAALLRKALLKEAFE